MGNLCSKSSNQSDPFSRPGRVLGTPDPDAQGPNSDARIRAAKAAKERAGDASKSSNQGPLARELAAQKSQTRVQTLTEASRVEIDARRADSLKISRWDWCHAVKLSSGGAYLDMIKKTFRSMILREYVDDCHDWFIERFIQGISMNIALNFHLGLYGFLSSHLKALSI